jgi:hypothetical protein
MDNSGAYNAKLVGQMKSSQQSSLQRRVATTTQHSKRGGDITEDKQTILRFM